MVDTQLENLLGVGLKQQIALLISHHGYDAVNDAVQSLRPKPKKGRKEIQDWPQLMGVIFADAVLWLAGRNPFVGRKNYSIAKQFAANFPEHMRRTTEHRIERKLRKKRVVLTLLRAVHISREGYPYRDHIRSLEALCQIEARDRWVSNLNAANSSVAKYKEKFGSKPPSEFSIIHVNARLDNLEQYESAQLGVSRQKGLGAATRFQRP